MSDLCVNNPTQKSSWGKKEDTLLVGGFCGIEADQLFPLA